jgi:hypothetical protein
MTEEIESRLAIGQRLLHVSNAPLCGNGQQIHAANAGWAVHQPNGTAPRDLVLKKNIGLEVAVKVSGARDVPVSAHIR